MGVALVRRIIATGLLAGVTLVTTGAGTEENCPPSRRWRWLRPGPHGHYLRRAGLCLFAIVWAGFLLMAEGGTGKGEGGARTAVVMAVVGLVWCSPRMRWSPCCWVASFPSGVPEINKETRPLKYFEF